MGCGLVVKFFLDGGSSVSMGRGHDSVTQGHQWVVG